MTLSNLISGPSEGAVNRRVNQTRFETELEFIQCLANPFYLQSLSQQGLLRNETFLRYLTYLKYWHQPQFAQYIQYPQCLHHMDLLSYESFRHSLESDPLLAQNLAGKQLVHWAGWRKSVTDSVGKAGMEADKVAVMDQMTEFQVKVD